MEKGGLSGNCTHLVTKGGSGETDRHRGDREGDKEVETDVRDKDLGQRDKGGREGTVMVQENTNCLHKRKSETSPESEPIPGGPSRGHCCQFLPQSEGWNLVYLTPTLTVPVQVTDIEGSTDTRVFAMP